MTLFVAIVFVLVYLGMMVGRIPGLAIDRTGIAALGAIALVARGGVTLDEAWQAIDVPTMTLLLALMVVSAQLRLGGLYTRLAQRISDAGIGPTGLLALLIAVAALLSSLLANDIVCLAFAPLLIDGCRRRGLRPLPFLLALACAANVGSAATIIGNPQNMLIGQVLGLSFGGYAVQAFVPTAIGCALVWWFIRWQTAGRWECPTEVEIVSGERPRPFDRWQTVKGLMVLTAMVVSFLLAPWPREVVAMTGAGVLLLSRRMHTREMLALVDWQLLILFGGLFVVNDALATSGLLANGMRWLSEAGVHVEQPGWLFGLVVVLSNLVSNVPAVMLLLPAAHSSASGGPVEVVHHAGLILALGSTLAGNMFIVASIANIIVVEQAGRMGVRISWADHARTGVPITLLTLAVAAVWIWVSGGMLN